MDGFEMDMDLFCWKPGRCCGTRPMMFINRNETQKAWREVCICLQEDLEALGEVNKRTLLLSIAIIY
jgi:hypothetical protein